MGLNQALKLYTLIHLLPKSLHDQPLLCWLLLGGWSKLPESAGLDWRCTICGKPTRPPSCLRREESSGCKLWSTARDRKHTALDCRLLIQEGRNQTQDDLTAYCLTERHIVLWQEQCMMMTGWCSPTRSGPSHNLQLPLCVYGCISVNNTSDSADLLCRTDPFSEVNSPPEAAQVFLSCPPLRSHPSLELLGYSEQQTITGGGGVSQPFLC